MRTLEEFKAVYKPETLGGLKVNFLASCGEGESFTVWATVYPAQGNWVTREFDSGGRSRGVLIYQLKERKPVIDYSRLPIDVLCQVMISKEPWVLRYSDGKGGFFANGRTSQTGEVKCNGIAQVRVVINKIWANVGTEFKILPDNVRVKVWRKEGAYEQNVFEEGFVQEFQRHYKSVFWYQILGE